MEIIHSSTKAVDNILGKQKADAKNLRLFKYVYFCDEENKLLVYNLLTREFVVLDEEEKKSFFELDFEKGFMKDLIQKWFFVENNFDDYKLFEQVNAFLRLLCDKMPTDKKTHFVIFTTTECNARCFYCFEHKNKKRSMTEKTANDVADYIIRKSKNNTKIKLTWFGGEPLYNYKVIDIITEKLTKNNIDFHSDGASNAYLFDDELVEKAVNNWKLDSIQITLDGTEDVYNKVKAYIYKDDTSPFVRVLNNIENLLSHNVFVNIRLNIDMHNYEDLNNLVDILADRFKRYNKCCNIYVTPLFDACGKTATTRTEEIREMLLRRCIELGEKIQNSGLRFPSSLYPFMNINHCMSDDSCSTTILPEGQLGKCEHYIDDNFYGSIYSEETSLELLKKFRKEISYGDFCRDCVLQPRCLYLEVCPTVKRTCEKYMKQLKISALEEQMRGDYHRHGKRNFYKTNDNCT